MSEVRRRSRPLFFGVVALVLALYTGLAFGMAWRTPSGGIGPGFFPRIIGVVAFVVCLVALVRGGSGSTEGADSVRHPKAFALVAVGLVGFFVLLTTLGALVAASAFLVGTLTLFNRRSVVPNIALGIGIPLALYALFDLLLNAKLPTGLL
ncbi:tripartite tricarboxylate transporter TctB family protein [Actinopolymorpha alba]|uniref:tripartite tricarboxylate transporter TctB family protein n=1 Tax=Actinopolymorpha alba TaxID=533267 RepID=UPI000362D570|nr:tripartite tricarboxylate transporter TctB family protein [Actinopolymorpha alba]